MTTRRAVPALKVHQWLKDWDRVAFDPANRRRRPDPHFYLFLAPAAEMMALCGISRRSTSQGQARAKDIGIQRRHDEERSKKIADFVKYGYPWSELSQSRRESGEYDDLLKPGWLPTAIVVNILKGDNERQGQRVDAQDLIAVEEDELTATIHLPSTFSGPAWRPTALHPMEVIDGQHRLWAFQDHKTEEHFELPVVAFHGLDVSWQAYLFWSINITPKRINASLAFDLYPLLRTEDWLERFEGHSVYRETRAQELTEALWNHPASPWYQRINMLGERGLGRTMVSQAAWIRSLMATYVKSWEGQRVSIGGLFGAPVGSHREVLPWSRAQQAAFLAFAGQSVSRAIKEGKEGWAESLRSAGAAESSDRDDPAFFGPYTLLSTDQGIRGLLYLTNDLCYARAGDLHLDQWSSEDAGDATDEKAVNRALQTLRREPVSRFLDSLAQELAKYDWRASSAPGLTDDEKVLKAAFRGSGGYRELRRQLLLHLSNQPSDISRAAREVMQRLGYS